MGMKKTLLIVEDNLILCDIRKRCAAESQLWGIDGHRSSLRHAGKSKKMTWH